MLLQVPNMNKKVNTVSNSKMMRRLKVNCGICSVDSVTVAEYKNWRPTWPVDHRKESVCVLLEFMTLP